MRLILLWLLAACDPDPLAGSDDLSQARSVALDDGGMRMTVVDFAVALPAHCPCPLNSYCDLATNSCKAGCLGNDQCPMGSLCDTQLFQCVAVCDPSENCPDHRLCQENDRGFHVCGDCDYGYDDCNHDPSDGCETALDTDANCGACGAGPNLPCYPDQDGDGYLPANATPVMRCNGCKTGEIALGQAKMGVDCDDNDGNVFPGQTAFPTKPTASGSWDYDCDGVITLEFDQSIFNGCDSSCRGQGWDRSAPRCGETRDTIHCYTPFGGSCMTAVYDTLTMGCR